MLFVVFLLGIVVSYAHGFVAVLPTPEWGNIKHLRTLRDYREATAQNCVVLFTSSAHETCKRVDPVFCEIAERADKHSFCLAYIQHEPLRRVAEVLEIDTLPTVVIYKGEDVYALPYTADLLSELPTILD